jgi:uncharacterized coiled-coil protein SlyX
MKYIAEIMAQIEDFVERIEKLEAVVAKTKKDKGRIQAHITKLTKRVQVLERSQVSTTLPESD